MIKKFTLKELADHTNSSVIGDENITISGVNSLEDASSYEASFLANPRYKELLKTTQAGLVCISNDTSIIEGKNYLVSDNPSKAFQLITDLVLSSSATGFKGIHSSATVHESAKIGDNVTIGPHVCIDQGCKIGDGSQIFANVCIGAETTIGKNCILYSNSTVRERCVLQDRVILQPGAVIGSCGYGYITGKDGKHQKIEQLGNVVLEDDVEIGANTTIDRARFKSTIIKQGTKIDNLVQIGHNVVLGEHNLIVSQTGISGSAKTGKYVVLGGQAGVVGHVEIADFAQIATRGGVSKNVTKAGQYGGAPLMPFNEFNKNRVHVRNIEKYVKRIKALEEMIHSLKENLPS
ncbi:MAG: UDP-3-O-acylglucosamine N-acyltransferase [Chlamydiia bacterium]|nr:UDP-3-O-acylglucosamine N-acyltransferase [Chlamydiia bacterium]